MDGLFHWKKCYNGLWTHTSASSDCLNLKCLDGFVFYKQPAFLYTRHNMMDWSDVDYLFIIVFYISCLDSHSDGTHSLQRIHWWASNGMLHFSKSVLMKKHSFTSWMAWRWEYSQQIFIFGWTTPSNVTLQHWANPNSRNGRNEGRITIDDNSSLL